MTAITRLAALVFAALCGACSAAEAPPVFEVEARLTVERGGSWTIDYAFSRPVARAVFPRSTGDYRRETWTIRTPGVVLERVGESDIVRRADGAPLSGFEAAFSPYSGLIHQEYTPVIRLEDGSAAIHLDQFHVGDGAFEGEDPLAETFESAAVTWPRSAWLSVERGDFLFEIGDGLDREPEGARYAMGDSGYLYIGDTEPLAAEALSAVIDTATPDWLRDALLEALPRIFALYGERFGDLDDVRPAVFAVYRPLDGRSFSLKGGAVGAQILLEMEIGSEFGDDPQIRRHLMRFFAHEAAHVWQFHHSQPADMSIAWIHEGGADAIAFLALVEMGEADADTARAWFESAAADCARYLESGPLEGALRRGEFRAYYDCGATASLAVHAAVLRAGGDGLFGFWAEFLARRAEAGRRYESQDYFALAAEQGGAEIAAALRAFTGEAQSDGAAAVAALLETAGLTADFSEDGVRLGGPVF